MAKTSDQTASVRRWVWYSTVESAVERKVSVLAIVETAAAAALYVFIAVHYETYLHLAISSSVAPFLLLRTGRHG